MKISNFTINKDSKAFIIAELSANHNGSLEVAIETIKAAKRAGANCIKLQTYTQDTLTIDSKKDDFMIKGGTIWDGTNYYSLYKKAHTPLKWHRKLFQYAKKIGVMIFGTPFDKTAVDFLEQLSCPMYKVSSFEMTDLPLIKKNCFYKKTNDYLNWDG